MLGLTGLATSVALFGYKALGNAVVNQPTKPPTKPNARLGMNLAGIAYWSAEFPFVNLMHQSGEWTSQSKTGAWGSGPPLSLDAHGWVQQLEKDCSASKVLCVGGEVPYPSGTYLLLYDGEGDVTLSPTVAKLRKKAPGRQEYEVDASKGALMVTLLSTHQQNHVRNIRVIQSEYEASYQDNPWHPAFLACWSGVACLRFMDMMATNNSTQQGWADRPTLNDASFIHKGVPVEMLIDLANRLNADPWFCMPHQANDEYVKQFAISVNKGLQPHLKAWLEYSNEVWNGGFSQYRYAAEQGKRLQLAKDEWEAAYRYNATRLMAIFDIWNTVFTQQDRLVRVIGSQAANIYLTKGLLAVDGLDHAADVLAIAPYVSLNVPVEPDGRGISLKRVSAWHLDDVFAYLDQVALPETERWMTDHYKAAHAHGLTLVAYESGQHMVGFGEAANSNKLTQLLLQANQDKRMGDIYRKHLRFWQAVGGDLICMYNSIGGWSKYGSWGLLKHIHDRDNGKAPPKFKAVMQWAQSRGQKVLE